MNHYDVISTVNVTSCDHRLLVVDDIVDSGSTIRQLGSRFKESNLDVVFVSLYVRQGAMPWPKLTAELLETENWLVFPYERSDEPPVRTKTPV